MAAAFSSQDRANHDVGLDVDHDDVLVGVDCGQRVAGASDGMASSLDDAVDLVASKQLRNIVGYEGRAVLHGVGCASSRNSVLSANQRGPDDSRALPTFRSATTTMW